MTENESLMEAVPVIDISPFTKDGSLESQQRVAQQFAEKASLNGCVGIRGHNVAHNILTEAFEMTKKLFDLPYDQKMKAPHPDGPIPHRGYSSVGRENAAQKTESENWKGTTKAEEYAHITDFKESYEIGSHDNKVEYNIWLPEGVFPGFREWSLGLYWELQKTAMAILEALIMSLDLEAGEQESVRRLFSGHDNQLRLLHYPPVERGHLNIATDGHRLGAHTDWGAFTLLFQDQHGGLQFLDRASGEFIDAVPRDGVLYMNIADMFQRISNGFYPSALHRVVVKNSRAPRYSIPYFVAPLPDAIIAPQPSRVSKDGKRNYEAITFKKYSEQMFQKINVHS